MKITFTNNAARAAHGKAKARRFVAGRTYDLPAAEAEYWIGRSAAVKAEDAAEADEGEEGGDDHGSG